MIKKSVVLILTAICCGVACSCKKNQQPYFPNVGFEEYIYLNNPSSQDLQTVSGYIYHTGGYKGLIVFRRSFDPVQPENDFIAFDRACPEHFNEDCGSLEVDDDAIFAVCGCNQEKYLLYDGAPSDGASLPLRQYRVVLNGNVLVVSN